MRRNDAALEYRVTHGGFPPDRFLDTPRRRAKIARARIGTPHAQGILTRLCEALEYPCAFVADGVVLGLPKASQHPRALYERARVDGWRSALWLAFVAPWWARLEIDENSVLHAHIVADKDASRLELSGQPIRNLHGLADYLAKPADGRGLEGETQYLRVKHRSNARVPVVSFSSGIAR